MSLDLDAAAKARIRRFHAEGLLYLANTSVLHPRGFALTLHVDDEGNPIGLSVQGDGTEPWCFGDELGNVVERYHAAERIREAAWTKPPPTSIPTPAADPGIDLGSPLA